MPDVLGILLVVVTVAFFAMLGGRRLLRALGLGLLDEVLGALGVAAGMGVGIVATGLLFLLIVDLRTPLSPTFLIIAIALLLAGCLIGALTLAEPATALIRRGLRAIGLPLTALGEDPTPRPVPPRQPWTWRRVRLAARDWLLIGLFFGAPIVAGVVVTVRTGSDVFGQVTAMAGMVLAVLFGYLRSTVLARMPSWRLREVDLRIRAHRGGIATLLAIWGLAALLTLGDTLPALPAMIIMAGLLAAVAFYAWRASGGALPRLRWLRRRRARPRQSAASADAQLLEAMLRTPPRPAPSDDALLRELLARSDDALLAGLLGAR